MGAARPRRMKPAIVVIVAGLAVATVFGLYAKPAKPLHKVATVPPVTVTINGKLVKIDVQDGQFVQKGQLIAELDSSGYQADLNKAEGQITVILGQAQSSIQPMEGIPGMIGSLPTQYPIPRTIRITNPDKMQSPKSKSEPMTVPQAAAVQPKPNVTPTAYQQALSKQQAARNALEKSTQDLARATADLSDAQKARDGLRPKMIQADLAASQAAKKADGAKELLEAGVISTKRSEELLADRSTTQKALDDMKAQVAAADQAITD